MTSENALILRCRTPALAERLVGVYAGLLAKSSFPFRFQMHINPMPELLQHVPRSHRCLFFLEVNSQESAEAHQLIDETNRRFRPAGHQLVLIADEASDYLDLAIRFGVGNVLFRDSIEPSIISALTNRLLGSEFFGFGPFFPNRWNRYEQHWTLTGSIPRSGLVEHYFSSFLDILEPPHRHRFHCQMSELLTNALAYGVLGVTAEQRDANWLHMPESVEIPEGKDVKVSVVQDDEKYGISVKDPGGALTLLRILQKLRRHTPIPGQSIPQGIDDLTGRGLYIVSRQTRLVINVLRGIQTEVILLSYFDEDRNRYKSLIINEKYPDPSRPLGL